MWSASKYGAMRSRARHGAVPVRCLLRCSPVKSQHRRRHQQRFLCRLPRCRRATAAIPRESLLDQRWNVVITHWHIQHMQTKWSEISGCSNLIQNKAGREQIGLLALLMTSPMDARWHYQWLHRWTPQKEENETIWSKTTAWIIKWDWNLTWRFQSRIFFDTIMLTCSWASIDKPDSAWEDRKLGAQDKLWKKKSIFNLKHNNKNMNHQMGLKLTLVITKQENLSCQFDSLMPSVHWT